jgi:hypothetical protein
MRNSGVATGIAWTRTNGETTGIDGDDDDEISTTLARQAGSKPGQTSNVSHYTSCDRRGISKVRLSRPRTRIIFNVGLRLAPSSCGQEYQTDGDSRIAGSTMVPHRELGVKLGTHPHLSFSARTGGARTR